MDVKVNDFVIFTGPDMRFNEFAPGVKLLYVAPKRHALTLKRP